MTAQLPIQKERLEKIASWRETYGDGHNVMLPAEEAGALARALLAAYEQEPVVENLRIADALESLLWPNMALGNKVIIQAAIDALRTHPAPSIPAVPDAATPEEIQIMASIHAPSGVTYQWDRDERNAASDSWNACRAAMLNGGNPSQDEYRKSLQELVKAMRDYEMDVGESAPYKHRAMMKRAEALLNGGKS